jgi:hypothetical protein
MLRRRGIPATMFAGVKLKKSSLIAHAWVQAGATVIDSNPDDAFVPVMRIGSQLPDR